MALIGTYQRSPIPRLKNPVYVVGSLFSWVLLSSCADQEYVEIHGPMFGTEYRIEAKCPTTLDVGMAERVFEHVNNVLSIESETSEISKFNQTEPRHWIGVSEDFLGLLKLVKTVSHTTDGAIRATSASLDEPSGDVSNTNEIAAASEDKLSSLSKMLLQDVETRDNPPALQKKTEVALNLSSVVNGFAVDQLAADLETNECSDFLVEIGEIRRVKGKNRFGNKWQIEIYLPDNSGNIVDALQLTDIGFASSRELRKKLDSNNLETRHVKDSPSGQPIDHDPISVTVLHEQAATAEAYSSALLVLGAESGIAFAEKSNLAVLYIARGENNASYELTHSTAMQKYVESD